jgi:hypothetical protein
MFILEFAFIFLEVYTKLDGLVMKNVNIFFKQLSEKLKFNENLAYKYIFSIYFRFKTINLLLENRHTLV